MHLHRNIPVRRHLFEIRVDIEEHSRRGTKSPSLYVIRYQGRRLVPYAWKREGFQLSFRTLLNLWLPVDLLKEEMMKPNRLLMSIGKDHDIWNGAPLVLPVEL